jgi:hypothetical protein
MHDLGERTIKRIARRVLHPEVVMDLVPSLGHR